MEPVLPNTENYWIIIPPHVAGDDSLPSGAKLVFGRIFALAQKEGFCWAFNDYISKGTGLSKETIKIYVSLLADKGYVISHVERGPNGAVASRKIFTTVKFGGGGVTGYPTSVSPLPQVGEPATPGGVSDNAVPVAQTAQKTEGSIDNSIDININNKKLPVKVTMSSKSKSKKDDFLSFLDAFNIFFKSSYRPTSTRREKYEVRRAMFTHEEIMEALTNLSASAWHHGENERGWVADPDFLLRNDEQVDKWLQKARPAPPIEPALRTSRNSFVPCSDLEIWEMAGELDVPIVELKDKQAEILRMAQDGSMAKYPKETNMYDTLKKWVRYAMERGRIPHMNELDRNGYAEDHPDKVKERNEAFDFIRKQEKT